MGRGGGGRWAVRSRHDGGGVCVYKCACVCERLVVLRGGCLVVAAVSVA